MTYLETLWKDLFGKDITILEEKVMIGVSEQFERDAPVTLLAAIIVRMLFLVLIEHKASPFKILRNFGQAMDENRQSVSRINETYADLHGKMEAVKIDIENAQHALREIREYAHAKVGYNSFTGYYSVPVSEVAQISKLTIAAFISACFGAAFLGSVIAMMIMLG
ncbi:hypothetical protein [Pseudopontixanthobacter vadosimaris]|uniref:hypothetical protein n=1 Tax=Pseudopontixanthobacter vadosimaris TaxID=2726450 RepID=UPI001472D4BB|nr:hypothetical protein [Pseudopontixanthobacter vadosimaris]